MCSPASQTTRHIRGGCLCGAVQYSVEDNFAYALNCHCSQCRRATGSAFKPFGGIERSKLSLVPEAAPLLVFGSDDAHDVRCAKCGSLLYSVVRAGKFAHIPLGTLHDAPSISPSAHIFVGSKAPWHIIDDNLPQHAELP